MEDLPRFPSDLTAIPLGQTIHVLLALGQEIQGMDRARVAAGHVPILHHHVHRYRTLDLAVEEDGKQEWKSRPRVCSRQDDKRWVSLHYSLSV